MPDARANAFLATALRTLRRVAVDEWLEDVSAAFFWWSNVQQMRLVLQQLDEGSLQVPGDWQWLHSELDPALQVCWHSACVHLSQCLACWFGFACFLCLLAYLR